MSGGPTELRQTAACGECWTQSHHSSCDGRWKTASEETLCTHTHATDVQQVAGETHTHTRKKVVGQNKCQTCPCPACTSQERSKSRKKSDGDKRLPAFTATTTGSVYIILLGCMLSRTTTYTTEDSII